jgi:hypothetical protein
VLKTGGKTKNPGQGIFIEVEGNETAGGKWKREERERGMGSVGKGKYGRGMRRNKEKGK